MVLVLGLDVILEGRGPGKSFIAMRTLVRLFTKMNSLDVDLEVTSTTE